MFHRPLHRVFGELGAGRQIKLLFYMFAVRLNGLGTDLEFDGDLAAAQTLSDQLKNLALPFGQPIDRRPAMNAGPFGVPRPDMLS